MAPERALGAKSLKNRVEKKSCTHNKAPVATLPSRSFPGQDEEFETANKGKEAHHDPHQPQFATGKNKRHEAPKENRT